MITSVAVPLCPPGCTQPEGHGDPQADGSVRRLHVFGPFAVGGRVWEVEQVEAVLLSGEVVADKPEPVDVTVDADRLCPA